MNSTMNDAFQAMIFHLRSRGIMAPNISTFEVKITVHSDKGTKHGIRATLAAPEIDELMKMNTKTYEDRLLDALEFPPNVALKDPVV